MVVPAFVNGNPVEFKIHHDALPEEVEARFGVTAQDCRTDWKARLLVNAAYYKELENHVPDRFLSQSRNRPSMRSDDRRVTVKASSAVWSYSGN
jgi:hypothetical protein